MNASAGERGAGDEAEGQRELAAGDQACREQIKSPCKKARGDMHVRGTGERVMKLRARGDWPLEIRPESG